MLARDMSQRHLVGLHLSRAPGHSCKTVQKLFTSLFFLDHVETPRTTGDTQLVKLTHKKLKFPSNFLFQYTVTYKEKPQPQ